MTQTVLDHLRLVIAWFLPFYLKRFTPLAFIRFFLGIEAGCLCNLDTLNVNTSPWGLSATHNKSTFQKLFQGNQSNKRHGLRL